MTDSLDLRIRLEVGSVTEAIEVKGGTPLLETANSSLSQIMDRKRLEDLPKDDSAVHASRRYWNA